MALAADLMGDALDPPADAVSLRRAIVDGAPHPSDWLCEAYFTEVPDLDGVSVLFQHTLDHDGGDALPAWTHPDIEELPDDDWVKFALGSLGPIEAGRFLLHGAHDRDTIQPGDNTIAIEIEANQAFGTGHHPTTAGCLMLLDRLAGIAPKSILDLGCGSAVLAIAAAKVWDRTVTASDIDSKSVAIARENCHHNGVGDRVHVFESAGFDNAQVTAHAPFDFIFANILAGPLIALAPDMARYTQSHGRVMLAGLMAEQEAQVTDAYHAAGYRQINRLDHPTWPVLLFVKA